MNRSYQFQNQRSFKCSENTRAEADFEVHMSEVKNVHYVRNIVFPPLP